LSTRSPPGPPAGHITLLHVIEPITLNYPTSREVHDHWQNILETDTPQGRNLRGALEVVRQAGFQPEFKVRHGDVVHQITDEASRGI
jgi:hypothetical protein